MSSEGKTNHSTVFVLGAGVSHPYGFPLGSKLLEEVKLEIGRRSTGYNKSHFDKLLNLIVTSQCKSIDQFLELHGEAYSKLIRPIISHIIYRYENEKNLFNGKGTFYDDLYNFIFDDEQETKFSIINFNYDRSLVHSLVLQMVARKKASDNNEAFKLLSKKVEIFTPFGTISPLPYSGKENGIPYGQNDSFVDFIENAAEKQINLYFEKAKHDAEMHNLVKNANTIFFLGMAYHKQNMDVVGINPSLKTNDMKLIGTHHGFTPRNYDRIKKHSWPIKFFQNADTVETLFENACDARGRNYAGGGDRYPLLNY